MICPQWKFGLRVVTHPLKIAELTWFLCYSWATCHVSCNIPPYFSSTVCFMSRTLCFVWLSYRNNVCCIHCSVISSLAVSICAAKSTGICPPKDWCTGWNVCRYWSIWCAKDFQLQGGWDTSLPGKVRPWTQWVICIMWILCAALSS